MNIDSIIEIARNLLNNAIEMNVDRIIIYKISRKIDQYLMMYYSQECGGLGVNAEEKDK